MMPITNLRTFALDYLIQWCKVDRRFVSGLELDTNKAERLETLRDAADNYEVIRNFPNKRDAGARLEGALAALDAIGRPEGDQAVISAVNELAKALQSKYGGSKISAASKFLWFRYKSPVAIYDSRARASLRRGGGTFGDRDYGGYLKDWRRQFAESADAIRAACAELIRVRDFLADGMSENEFIDTTSSRWFHERVFDKYLWWNGQRVKAQTATSGVGSV